MWADTRMLLPRSFYAFAGLDFSCVGRASRVETGHLVEQESYNTGAGDKSYSTRVFGERPAKAVCSPSLTKL